MKTLIFSDTHLTDKFQPRLYKFLEKIISDVDQVIINGDFWDGMAVTFDQFINSEWKKLFTLLKSKKTIYIYGNHDRKSYADSRTNQFSDLQVEEYKLKTKLYKLHIEHGHRIVPFNDLEVEDPVKTYKKGNDIYDVFESMAARLLFGFNFHIYRKLFSKKMKSHAQNSLAKNEILVTGHIHAPEFDLKNKHVNTFLRHNKAYYLIVNDDLLEFKTEKI